jgi:hypothetical protein
MGSRTFLRLAFPFRCADALDLGKNGEKSIAAYAEGLKQPVRTVFNEVCAWEFAHVGKLDQYFFAAPA